MKQIKLEINIEACHYDELTEKDRKLIDAACEATKRSYAPYSHFAVGAGPENLPNAHKMADCVICLPMHHALGEEEIQRTLDLIVK